VLFSVVIVCVHHEIMRTELFCTDGTKSSLCLPVRNCHLVCHKIENCLCAPQHSIQKIIHAAVFYQAALKGYFSIKPPLFKIQTKVVSFELQSRVVEALNAVEPKFQEAQ